MDNSLSLMFQNGMKPLGALALGQQLPVQQQTDQANLESLQLANQKAAQMNPLDVQFRQGQINQQDATTANTQAQLPGLIGQSQSQTAQGQYDTQTLSGRIASRLSDLSNQIGVNGVQKMGRDGAILSQASAALDQYPPYMHKQVLQQLVSAYGGDPNDPTYQGILNMPDNQVAKAAAVTGKGMVMASGEYMQKQALQSQELQSRQSIAAGQQQTERDVANINGKFRVEAAEKKVQQMMNHMTTDQKMAYLSDRIASGDASDAEKAQYTDLHNKKMQQRAAGVNPLAAQMTGQQAPVQAIAPDTGFGQPSAGPNNAGAAQAGAGDVQKMAQSSWGAYEPDKYDYRIGPNGNLQRKPK